MRNAICMVGLAVCLMFAAQGVVSANWCPWEKCVDLDAGPQNVGDSQCCLDSAVLHQGDCTNDDPADAYTCQNRRRYWSDDHDANCSGLTEEGTRDCERIQVLRQDQIGGCAKGACFYFFVPGSAVLIDTRQCVDRF